MWPIKINEEIRNIKWATLPNPLEGILEDQVGLRYMIIFSLETSTISLGKWWKSHLLAWGALHWMKDWGFIYYFKDFTYFIVRERRREGERKQEEHLSVASRVRLNWRPNLQPRHAILNPSWDMKPQFSWNYFVFNFKWALGLYFLSETTYLM